MKAIVTGMIGTYPVGGVAWDYGQYALGLKQLGFDVYYLEDTGCPTYDPVAKCYGDDCSFAVSFLQRALCQLMPELKDRWHFRSADGQSFGLTADDIRQIADESELFLNVSGSTLLRDSYMGCPRKVLIDTDPGWNHFVNYPKWDANPGWQETAGYRAHDHFFTYAERIGSADCELPDLGIDWLPTRPVVATDCWRPQPPGDTWTTVMTWNNFSQPIPGPDRVYGTKELEFSRVESLPGRLPLRLEVAVGGASPPVDRWSELGWSVVDSHQVSRTMNDYRDYIERSRGEFSVTKNIYAATRSGWFSCRSVCYLAAGRPVVVQDTGCSELMPTGEGLFVFSTLEQAITALEAIESDYAFHQARAYELAKKFFDAPVVLGRLLQRIGIG